MKYSDYLEWASLTLVVLAAINTGLIGLGNIAGFNFNLLEAVFSPFGDTAVNLVYLLIGFAGVYQVYFGYQLYGNH
ncbi:MAG: DUF378 domain-containing protein [Candidatus Nanohaloarchaea archaeon]